LGGGKDTSGIVLPWLSISADGKRHLLEVGVDGGLIFSNRDDSRDLQVGGSSARRGPAGLVFSLVRIARFSIKTTLLDNPVEGFSGVTTVATLVGGIAINDFLRSTDGLSTASQKVSRLNSLGGGESPAGTALFLVLDWSGHSLGDPIDGLRRGFEDNGSLDREGTERLSGTEAEHLLGELFSAQVSEFGVSEGGRSGSSVELLDLFTSKNEVPESVLSFFGRGVSLVPESVKFVERDTRRHGSASRHVHTARCKETEREDEEQ